MKQVYEVRIIYANGITRYTTMRAKSEKEAIQLAVDAFFLEGERGLIVRRDAWLQLRQPNFPLPM